MNTTASKICKNLSRFRLITFDVTDTLLKFRLPPAIQYKETAYKYGYNINENEINNIFRNEFKHMFKNYPNFGKNSNLNWRDWWRKLIFNIFSNAGISIADKNKLEKLANELINIYRTETGDCWIKTNGADDLVTKVKELNKNIGIISNFDPSLHDVIGFMKFPKFNFILTSYEVGVPKPKRDIFERALELSGNCTKCDEALHIGNSLELDYLGALNAGWSSLLIVDPNDTSSNSSVENNTIVNKDHVFNSLEHALQTLEKNEIKW